MLNAGTYLGNRYEVIEKIGTGGMSDVYLAMDHSLDREVAIKVLKQEYAEDNMFVSKFRAEAQSAAGLEHPNIVNIYDVGNEDGLYYIVMERIEGITLKTYIAKKGQLSYNEVISIAIQVGRGIEAAHKKNIVHRDIKPQNIMISREGKVKVTDFGIARAVSSNTINADLMGSVHYSSPEQARNGFVSFQSDIYSLGIVMYEMCTGRVPYDGDTAVSIAIQHLQSEMPHPSIYAPNLPVSVEKIILKCTMKSQDRRYATIGDLLIDLKKALVNPDEDFVTIPDAEENEKTKAISEEELSEIQKKAPEPEPVRREVRVVYDDDDDDDDDDDGIINPRLDKAITIMGVAAAIVIIGIFIYLISTVVFDIQFFTPQVATTGETVGTTETETGSGDSSSGSGSGTSGDSTGGGSNSTKKSNAASEQVSVPDIVGMTTDEAKTALSAKGLGIKAVSSESSNEYEDGQIIKQTPAANETVEKNTTIKVTLSTGKGEIEIPNVKGRIESTAESLIKDAGFKCIKEYKYSDNDEQGTVMSQSPSGGSLGKEGDTITITVSQGEEASKVPNVIGKEMDAAIGEMEAAGFFVDVETAYSSTVSAGYVVSQSVSAGENKPMGTKIKLVISGGAEVEYYNFSFIAEPMENLTTIYTLKDSTGTTLETWSISSQTTISMKNLTSPSGTLYYDNLAAGGNTNGSQAVTFNRQ